MAEPKTQPTTASVSGYLDALRDARVRADCRTLLDLMQRASGEPPVMWGTSIVGFGAYRYTYASGRTGDWPLTGFAPRAKDITVYLMDGFAQRQAELARLGPHKHSVSCLYLKSLDGIDLRVLASMVADSVKTMRARWPAGRDGAVPAATTKSAPSRTRVVATSAPSVQPAATRKAATKKAAPKTAAKKTAAKKAVAKKATAKGVGASTAAARKSAPRKVAPRKVATSKPGAAPARRAAARKARTTKAVARR